MDPVKILKRAWYILWSYRALWVFGLILALATAGSTGRGSNNGVQYEQGRGDPAFPQSMQEAFREASQELQKLFREGIPDANITGETFSTLLWIIGTFVVLILLVGIVVAIARYVSETAVIRMVDEYENSGNKMTVRQGFQIGWSRTAWRLFLINLIVSLPTIILVLVLIGVVGGAVYFMNTSGNGNFTPLSLVAIIGFVFLLIFVTVILTIVLRLLRHFFWRVCVLEGASVRESIRRGYAMVRENWKNVGLMWLVMIGLGIVWSIVSILAIIVTIPVVIITGILAAIVVAIPFLLLAGAFTLFLAGPLPWIAAVLFMLPLFFVLAFSPWLLLGSWQAVYTSTVWTLTYREIKALPALTVPPLVEPTGS